jgi:hypothetical protein
MDAKTQKRLLFGVAVLTVIAAVFAPSPEEPVEPSHEKQHLVVNERSSNGASKTAQVGNLFPVERKEMTEEPSDLFFVDKPPPPPAEKPPKPVAPPLPYVYMGKMVDETGLTVFVTRNNKPYVVHSGDILDAQYRVESIKPPLMELTYLPLKEKQVLNIGVVK